MTFSPEAKALEMLAEQGAATRMKFSKTELPKASEFYMPTITLMKDLVERFHEQYFKLGCFAADICGVRYEELNDFHLMRRIYRLEQAESLMRRILDDRENRVMEINHIEDEGRLLIDFLSEKWREK